MGRKFNSESRVKYEVRTELDKMGVTLFSNPVGTAFLPNGDKVKYGLGKGSPDLVGWLSTEVKGVKIALFVALEAKREVGGTVSPEQHQWLKAAKKRGVICGVVRSAKEAKEIVENELSKLNRNL